MNRALRAATMGVLLFSPVALSACSAGQVTQTATQERDKVGAMAQVGDLTLRQVELAFPDGGMYERGDDAELRAAFVNSGTEDDTLIDISGEGFRGVEVDDDSAGTGSGTGNGRSTESSTIEIPADSAVYIGGDDVTVTLTDLQEPLTTGQSVELTFTFEKAGEVTVLATVANPEREQDRGEAFDFHQEEGEEH